MSVFSDMKVLYHLLLKPIRGGSHAERMESFYGGQAEAYDSFRRRLLQGREEMVQQVTPPEDAVWVDMGGGTGANLEFLGDRIKQLKKIYVVDLAGSLLDVARERFAERGWNNAEAVEADATTFVPEEGLVDVVTFSYSLTMIPDWFSAIENAIRILKPGGLIGVADFFVSRKWKEAERVRHSWLTRTTWPVYFAFDNVFPSRDHVPFLLRHFEQVHLEQKRAKVPYLPLVRTPYYTFVGRKPSSGE